MSKVTTSTWYIVRYLIAARPEAKATVGTIIDYAGDSKNIPKYFLECDGRKLGKQQYPELYAIIGDTFRKQEKNPRRKWYTFWEPKTIPESLFYDFRLPDFRGRV